MIFSHWAGPIWPFAWGHFVDSSISNVMSKNLVILFIYLFVYLFNLFSLFRASPAAYRSSQARGRIGAVAAGLHHSHSNTGSEPYLRPTPQLTAVPYPLCKARDRTCILMDVLVRFLSAEPRRELPHHMCSECPSDKIGWQYLYHEILIFVALNFDKNGST